MCISSTYHVAMPRRERAHRCAPARAISGATAPPQRNSPRSKNFAAEAFRGSVDGSREAQNAQIEPNRIARRGVPGGARTRHRVTAGETFARATDREERSRTVFATPAPGISEACAVKFRSAS
jgi:hypothetical protein